MQEITLRLYKISERELSEAIEMPDISEQEGNRTIAMRKFKDRFSGCPLKVVYEEKKGELFIVTAYPLKKRTWR